MECIDAIKALKYLLFTNRGCPVLYWNKPVSFQIEFRSDSLSIKTVSKPVFPPCLRIKTMLLFDLKSKCSSRTSGRLWIETMLLFDVKLKCSSRPSGRLWIQRAQEETPMWVFPLFIFQT
jgi:hypothetical protein